jgi:hypothetical protein
LKAYAMAIGVSSVHATEWFLPLNWHLPMRYPS